MASAVLLVVPLALFAGCAFPLGGPVEALPVLPEGEVVGLRVQPSCVARDAPFRVHVTLANPTAREGRIETTLVAQQHGKLGTVDAVVAPGGTAEATREAAIPQAGSWTIYATGPHVRAERVVLRVVDPGAGQRCP